MNIPPKGQCLCNKGCVRVGNLTNKEADECRSNIPCDKCSEDIRMKCYKKYIIEKDKSVY